MRKIGSIIIFWIAGMAIGFMVVRYGVVKAIKSKFGNLNVIIWCWVGVAIINIVGVIASKLLKANL